MGVELRLVYSATLRFVREALPQVFLCRSTNEITAVDGGRHKKARFHLVAGFQGWCLKLIVCDDLDKATRTLIDGETFVRDGLVGCG